MSKLWALPLAVLLGCHPAEPVGADGADLAGVPPMLDLATHPQLDLAPTPDLVPGAKDEVLASGHFSMGGMASLVRKADGSLVLTFSSDFVVDAVACPSVPPDDVSIVLMSLREQIPMWDSRFDLKIAGLKAAKGAQSYTLMESDPVGRPYIHVFCYPNPRTPLKQYTMSLATVRLP